MELHRIHAVSIKHYNRADFMLQCFHTSTSFAQLESCNEQPEKQQRNKFTSKQAQVNDDIISLTSFCRTTRTGKWLFGKLAAAANHRSHSSQ